METFAAIIGLWDKATDLAADINEKDVTVRQWKNRDSIPADRWTVVVAAAGRRGFEGVTFETLARIAAKKAEAA